MRETIGKRRAEQHSKQECAWQHDFVLRASQANVLRGGANSLAAIAQQPKR